MAEDEATVVDLGAAQRPTAAEIREWATDQRIFISSVMSGMDEERAAVARAIGELGASGVMFERFDGRDEDPEVAYLTAVAGADT